MTDSKSNTAPPVNPVGDKSNVVRLVVPPFSTAGDAPPPLEGWLTARLAERFAGDLIGESCGPGFTTTSNEVPPLGMSGAPVAARDGCQGPSRARRRSLPFWRQVGENVAIVFVALVLAVVAAAVIVGAAVVISLVLVLWLLAAFVAFVVECVRAALRSGQ